MSQTRLSGQLIRSGSIPASAISGILPSASFASTASAATSITFVPTTASFATTASYAVSASVLIGGSSTTDQAVSPFLLMGAS